MGHSIANKLAGAHPKMLAARIEGDRKPLAEDPDAREIGRRIERALEIAHLTKDRASREMGYQDASALSRWIAAVERPHFDKLNKLDGFDDAYLVASAEGNRAVSIKTVVEVVRRIA